MSRHHAVSCPKKNCGCLCPGCKYARRNRKAPDADARHCHIHTRDCHWKGCTG